MALRAMNTPSNAPIFLQTHPPDCVNSIADLVALRQRLSGPVYFRGQADETWPLWPTIARLTAHSHAGLEVPVYDLERQEEDLLHRFRRQTYEHQGRLLRLWEALILARHYGLPVRLLDWTSNPLVALYWAAVFERDPGPNGAIWWFHRRPRPRPDRDIDILDDPDLNYRTIKGVRLIYPFYPTPRMTAQSALFTIQEDPRRDLRYLRTCDYPPEDLDILEGGKWVILSEKKASLLKELFEFGISARTLFPELDAVPRGLLQTEVFRDRSQYA